MKLQLRPYQERANQLLRDSFQKGNKRVILCLPTGAGKTFTFSMIAKQAAERNPNKKVLILTDRIELLTQAGGALRRIGLEIGFIASGVSMLHAQCQIIVGMVETYHRRVKRGLELKDLGLIIIDEAHKGNFKKIIKHHQDIPIIGATATPTNQSRKDPLKNYFEDIVVGTDIPELIKLGYLSKPRYFAVKLEISAKTANNGDYKAGELFNDMNKMTVYDGCVDNYKAHALGKKTIVFCVNMEHARLTAEKFTEEGFNAKYITSDDDKVTRTQVLKWFSETKDAILSNCGILTTGYDEPTIECVLLNRATKSLPLFLQMVGRGSRVTEEKKEFTVIDMGNNLETHGLWDNHRDWEDIFFNPKKPKDGGRD